MQHYGNNDWRDYHLAHYGVKGMKKGKHLPGTSWWQQANGLMNKARSNWATKVTGSAYRRGVKQNLNKARFSEASKLTNVRDGKLRDARRESDRTNSLIRTANANQKSYYEKSLKGKAENYLRKKLKRRQYYSRDDLYR